MKRRLRLFGRGRRGAKTGDKRAYEALDAAGIEYAYTVYWTKQVRDWDAARRTAAASAIEALIAQPDFDATAFERQYALDVAGDGLFAGASVLALRKVLRAFH